MKSHLYHIEINVSSSVTSFAFYKDFLGYLGFRVIHEESSLLGLSNGTTDLWLVQAEKRFLRDGFHRKRVGLNHLAFRVDSREEVDYFHQEFLRRRGIRALYDSPKPFPAYSSNYYAVFFEDPDRIKLEVVYL